VAKGGAIVGGTATGREVDFGGGPAGGACPGGACEVADARSTGTGRIFACERRTGLGGGRCLVGSDVGR